MKKPYLGQPVIYKDSAGNECPAVVHRVWGETCVNLTYFTDDGPQVQTSAQYGTDNYQWQYVPAETEAAS